MRIVFSILICSSILSAQPELYSWMRNTTGLTGYNGITANVDSVVYSGNYVYVRASGIPAYTIGPWPGNPNTPTDQKYLFKFSRSAQQNNGTKTSTPLGHIGMFINGVAVYNALDAVSYNNQNIWHQDAVYVEAPSFDAVNGHPAPGGRYHHHQNPKGLYVDDSTKHSPILGFGFDGFPIYGPRGYKNSDGTGGIIRMTSSYRLQSITTRTNGPNVGAQYPLGYYVEDYEYVSGLGTLDEYNGRFTKTPEYPNGTYAYFTTIDGNGKSVYPYLIGPKYYGIASTENFQVTQVTLSEPAIKYNGPTVSAKLGDDDLPKTFSLFQNYPNPFNPATTIQFAVPRTNSEHITLKVFNVLGVEIETLFDGRLSEGVHTISFKPRLISSGIYYYTLRSDGFVETKRMVLLK